MKPAHIGIVACSAEGAALCYRTICTEGPTILGPHAHPEVSLHSLSLADYVACLDRDDLKGVAALMLASAEKLAKIGADFLISPDNTIHAAFGLVNQRSPLPWLHIAEVVAVEARAKGYKRLGITGTKWLVESEVYPESLSAAGLDYRRPRAEERDRIDRIIMDELVAGVFRPESTRAICDVIARFKSEEGCDAVVLGCTELPLVIDEANSPLPVLDSTRLLARAALLRAVSSYLYCSALSLVTSTVPVSITGSMRPAALELDQRIDAEAAHVLGRLGDRGRHLAGEDRGRGIGVGVEADDHDIRRACRPPSALRRRRAPCCRSRRRSP